MLSVSSLLDFLMGLLRDDAAKAEFESDPEGVLARNGFDGLCGEDVADARSLLSDSSAVHYSGGGGGGHSYGGGHGHGAVPEIKYVINNYAVAPGHEFNGSFNDYIIDYTYVDNRDVIGDNNVVNWGDIYNDHGVVQIGNGNAGAVDNSINDSNIGNEGTIVEGDNNGNIANGDENGQINEDDEEIFLPVAPAPFAADETPVDLDPTDFPEPDPAPESEPEPEPLPEPVDDGVAGII